MKLVIPNRPQPKARTREESAGEISTEKQKGLFIVDRDGVSFEVGQSRPDVQLGPKDRQIGETFFASLRTASTEISRF